MKKIVIMFAVTAILLSCTGKKGNQYKITGVVKGTKAEMVYLQKMDSTGWVTMDSATVKKLSRTINLPGPMFPICFTGGIQQENFMASVQSRPMYCSIKIRRSSAEI